MTKLIVATPPSEFIAYIFIVEDDTILWAQRFNGIDWRLSAFNYSYFSVFKSGYPNWTYTEELLDV